MLTHGGSTRGVGQLTHRDHGLKGDRKGTWALTVRANGRVTFRFDLEANLDELNLTVAEAAKTLKITRQKLHSLIQGKSAVTPEMALRRFVDANAGGLRSGSGAKRHYDSTAFNDPCRYPSRSSVT